MNKFDKSRALKREYLQKLKEDNPKAFEKSWQRHKQRQREINRKYAESHREHIEVYRCKLRGYGYIPLNEPFPNSHGHHINKDYVVYIPKELHNAVIHKRSDPITMAKINRLALDFLVNQKKSDS